MIFEKKEKKNILIFSGAGVSQESGISTFRDSNGLWENHSIEEVATPNGWRMNRKLVLDFYNVRRRQLKEVEPNQAHILIAKLEEYFNVTVVTQNVDNLHERGGSSNVIHLHGELTKVRSTLNPSLIYNWDNDLGLEDKCELGSQLRPHIVWFGEVLDEKNIELANIATSKADYCIIIGTSLQVYPANEIPFRVKSECPIYIIDPNAESLNVASKPNLYCMNQKASEGMEIMFDKLTTN